MVNNFSSSLKIIRRESSLTAINLDILIALFPCAFWAVFLYGARALWMLLASVAISVAADALICAILKKDSVSFLDLSSAVSGAVIALLMPVSESCVTVSVLSLVSVVILRAVPFVKKLPICPPACVLAVATLFLKDELTSFPSPTVTGKR